MMVQPIHWIVLIGVGVVLIALGYGDMKKLIRINNSGLEFVMWIVVGILFFTWLLPKALFIM